MRWMLLIGVTFIIISFYFLILSLMHLFPFYISAPLMFISIMITLNTFNNRKRFKGFG
ncbi:hypothetical protein [Bacillus sp. FJAT-45350]|uniref:hypothetical protein n=1 Tax=Bacillus sp. FJAT-45350 TaxID=2011014 RepID=UPI0015CBB6A3